MAQLSSFVNALHAGGARANQFEVTMTAPAPLGRNLTFLCRSASIPAATIGEVAVPYRGRQVFVAGDRTYDAWTVSVFSDASWLVRGAFERWQQMIQDMGSSTDGFNAPTVYYAIATVKQLNRNGFPLNTYALSGVWPQSLDAIDLAYDTNDAIMEFGITMRFNSMVSSKGGGTP